MTFTLTEIEWTEQATQRLVAALARRQAGLPAGRALARAIGSKQPVARSPAWASRAVE